VEGSPINYLPLFSVLLSLKFKGLVAGLCFLMAGASFLRARVGAEGWKLGAEAWELKWGLGG